MNDVDRKWNEARAKEKLIDSETALAAGKPNRARALAEQANAQILLARGPKGRS